MRVYIFICLALICMAIGYSGIFKKKFVTMMPLSVFSSILVLYCFGLSGHLKLGAIVFIGIAFLVFLTGLTKSIVRRQMKTLVSNVLNFGFFVFLAALVLIYYMTDGRLLSRFDEFTHWGLTVKNYMIFDGFANIAGSTTHGAGYQPGVSLFCYLFTALRDHVNECDMLKAMDVFVVSMLIPVFRRINWKRIVIGIFLLPFVICLPWLFTTYIIPYNTLYIDCAMGVTLGFLIYYYFTNEQSKGTYFMMALGSAALVMIRPGSEAFAIMLFVMILLDVLMFKRHEFKHLCRKGGWIMPVIYVLLTGASWYSWRIFTSSNSMMQVLDYVEPAGGTGEIAETIKANFFTAMQSVPENATIRISYILWLVVFVALTVILIFLAKGKKARLRCALASVAVMVGYVLYAGTLLYMYLHLFTEYEGLTLASLDRYMFTFILAAVVFYLYMIIEKIFVRYGGLGNILILIPIAVILIFTPWSRLTSDMFNCREAIESTVSKRAEYYKFEEFAEGIEPAGNRVYFIAQNSNGYEYQTAYYLATPVSLSYDYAMGWSLGYPYSDEDVWTLKMTDEEWEKALIDGGYTYVYLYNVDRQFRSLYGSLFEYDTAISNQSAFRVDMQEGHVVLKRVY